MGYAFNAYKNDMGAKRSYLWNEHIIAIYLKPRRCNVDLDIDFEMLCKKLGLTFNQIFSADLITLKGLFSVC